MAARFLFIFYPTSSYFIFGKKNCLFDNRLLGISKPKITPKFLLNSIIISIGFLLIYSASQLLAFNIFEKDFLDFAYIYNEKIPDDGFMRYSIIVYFSITAGFVEEFFYRGILKLSFSNIDYSKVSYYLLSGFLFGIVHWHSGIYTVFPAFIVGIYAAIAYINIGSLWPLIIGHTLTDFVYFYFFN